MYRYHFCWRDQICCLLFTNHRGGDACDKPHLVAAENCLGQSVKVLVIFFPAFSQRCLSAFRVQSDLSLCLSNKIKTDPLRTVSIFMRKVLGHTAVSAIQASSVTL